MNRRATSGAELYSLRGNQLPGFDDVLLRALKKDPEAFDKLRKAQRRAVLRSKIFATIFADFKKMIARQMTIKTS